MAWRTWYIALIDPTETFDPKVHNRWDLPAARLRISETEENGQASVTMVLATTTDALRGPGANTWIFLSRERADGSMLLMAKAQLVGTPLRGATEDDLPVVEWRCSPVDWRTPEAAACAPKQLLPFYDPVLVAPERRADAREILDGWFATVHCDRATHVFSTPDKFGIGLPALDFGWPLVDPLPSTDQRGSPVSEVDLSITCEIVQSGEGVLDISDQVKSKTAWGFLDTLTPDQLEKSWPKPGTAVNGSSGWTVVQSSLTRLDPTAFPSQIPSDAPLIAGPFSGAPEKQHYVQYYSWVNDRTQTVAYTTQTLDGRSVKRFNYSDASNNANDPGSLLGAKVFYERAYYDCRFSLYWQVRQKRVETFRARFVNGCQGLAPGAVKTLSLKCEDVTDTSSTQPWLPFTQYKAGDERVVGYTLQQCLADHMSAAYWASDQTMTLPNGTTQALWQQVPGNLAPLADRSQPSYLRTARGSNTIQACFAKVRRIFAESTRNVEVRFSVALDTPAADAFLAVSTAMSGTVHAPPDVIDGGGCTAKVTSYELVSEAGGDEYLDVTLTAATGSGLPNDGKAVTYDAAGNVIVGPVTVADLITLNASGNVWDVLAVGNVGAFSPVLLPLPTALPVIVNGADDQSTFVNNNCFSIGAGRTDDRAYEPDNLLPKAPTGLILYLTQVSGNPAMRLDILPTVLGTWNGPRQYDTEAA